MFSLVCSDIENSFSKTSLPKLYACHFPRWKQNNSYNRVPNGFFLLPTLLSLKENCSVQSSSVQRQLFESFEIKDPANMVSKKPIKVLSSLRAILKVLNLTNTYGVRIGCWKIPSIIITSLVVLVPAYASTMLLWFCVDEHFNPATMSSSLALALLLIQVMLFHFVMIWKSEKIVETLDYLQNIVTQRKYS